MPYVLRNFWREDRAPDARGPGRGDAVFAALVVAAALTEGFLDVSLTWRVFSVALTVALAFTLPWRRVMPLRMTTLAFCASVRYQDAAGRRALEQVRLRERERLARELHDTVAHHVSAIAVQAQAGRALAATRPDAPAEALAVIEEAASRTLTEMRRMVSTLRDDAAADRAPATGFGDLEQLAQRLAGGPEVVVALEGELEDVGSILQSTVYRLAQEAVTNARRHARGATRVQVRVEADRSRVRLTVIDDGASPIPAPTPGFGLRGMSERTALLGGRFQAGPEADGGWRVEAELPREMSA